MFVIGLKLWIIAVTEVSSPFVIIHHYFGCGGSYVILHRLVQFELKVSLQEFGF